MYKKLTGGAGKPKVGGGVNPTTKQSTLLGKRREAEEEEEETTTTTTTATTNGKGKGKVQQPQIQFDLEREIEEDDDEEYGSGEDDDTQTNGTSGIEDDDNTADDVDDEEEEEEEIIYGSDQEDNGRGFSGLTGKQYSDDPNQFWDDDDSSEDESLVNRVGNIPLEWYNDYDHIGYDVDGNKIMKGEKKDSLDRFIEQSDPNFWRTVYDKVNDKQVVLSDKDLQFIKDIQNKKFPHGYDPYKEWYVGETKPDVHPLSSAPTPKKSLLPNMEEEMRIRKLTGAIRRGWIKINEEDKEAKKRQEFSNSYDLWAPKTEQEIEEDELLQRTTRRISRIQAPKMKLPGNVESFNPPEEYLLTKEEVKAWHMMPPARRPHSFIPVKLNHMRNLGVYNRSIKERFERCLDLYLCPRVVNTKKQLKDVSHLLPKLPKPQDLRPFPSHEELQFLGHKGRVRSISINPTGQFLASTSDDQTVKIWEVATTRCLVTIDMEETVNCVSWNPNKNLNILAVAFEDKIALITPKLYGKQQNEETEAMFAKSLIPEDQQVKWYLVNKENDVRMEIHFEFKIKSISWHYKGDYFSTISPDDKTKSIRIHCLSKKKSQAPFKRGKTPYQSCKFHPSKPIFFLADQNQIKIYDLMKQQLIKKFDTGCKFISSIDVHPSGDHIIMSGYDKKVSWFDMDMSKVYKTLRYHKQAVRRVVFHPTLPLFSSCSDDLSIHVFHGTVYDDYLQNALIVPLKVLRTHKASSDGLGVLDIVFHPTQAWVFSAGADSTIRLYI